MTEAVLKGLALGFVLALSVGPIIFTIIKQSLNSGHKGGFSFVIGVWVSDIILVFLSNTVSSLVNQMLEHKSAIAIAGSAFLVSMGIYFAVFKKAHLPTDAEGKEARFRKRDMARIFASGFIINTLNPGVILFWLGNATVLSVDHTLQERIIIFSVCLLINMGADVLKVMMAGKLRSKLTLRTLTIVNKISGSLLILFGLALVLFSHRIMH
ncbi:MAG TPA: LysE family translocator [Puia sp.]|jgi:threonine/homoserine/homoserine lactone efflux protein